MMKPPLHFYDINENMIKEVYCKSKQVRQEIRLNLPVDKGQRVLVQVQDGNCCYDDGDYDDQ